MKIPRLLRRLLLLGLVVFVFTPVPKIFAAPTQCGRAAGVIFGGRSQAREIVTALNEDLQAFDLSRGRTRVGNLKTLSEEMELAASKLQSFEENLDQDPNFSQLLQKILFEEKPQILLSEVQSLARDDNYLRAIKVAIAFRGLRNLFNETLSALGRSLQGQERKYFHFNSAQSTSEYFQYLYWDLAHPVLATLSPFPLPANRAPTAPIFRELWLNSHFVPGAKELDDLRRFSAEQMFYDQKAFQLRNPKWTTVRRWIGHAKDFAIFASFLAVGHHAWELARGGTIGVDEFLAKNQTPPENEIYLMLDTVPLPHLSLMAQDRVYTYGQTHLRVEMPKAYFMQRSIQDRLRVRGLLKDPDEPEAQTLGDQVSQSLGTGLAEILKLSGLATAPQSLQIVPIRISSSEMDQLIVLLESHRGKRYENETMVNDCATMILRALYETTWLGSINSIDKGALRLVDASPSQMMMYFSSLRTRSKWTSPTQSIGEAFTLTIEDHSAKAKHFWRNLWINAMESKLLINLFFINQIHRLYFDVTKAEKIQSYDPEVLAVIEEELAADARESIEGDLQIELFERQVANPSATANKAQLRQTIADYFDDRIAAENLEGEDPRSDLIVRTLSRYRVALLIEKQNQLLSALDAKEPR